MTVNHFVIRKGFIKKAVLWAMTGVCFVSIFLLSNQPAESSDHLSKSVAERGSEVASQVAPSASRTQPVSKFFTNKFVREAAHIIIFFLMALFLTFSLKAQNVKHPYILSAIICILYAVIDETYQGIFVDGRSFGFMDIIRDWCGSLSAILIVGVPCFVNYIKNKRERKTEVEDV